MICDVSFLTWLSALWVSFTMEQVVMLGQQYSRLPWSVSLVH